MKPTITQIAISLSCFVFGSLWAQESEVATDTVETTQTTATEPTEETTSMPDKKKPVISGVFFMDHVKIGGSFLTLVLAKSKSENPFMPYAFYFMNDSLAAVSKVSSGNFYLPDSTHSKSGQSLYIGPVRMNSLSENPADFILLAETSLRSFKNKANLSDSLIDELSNTDRDALMNAFYEAALQEIVIKPTMPISGNLMIRDTVDSYYWPNRRNYKQKRKEAKWQILDSLGLGQFKEDTVVVLGKMQWDSALARLSYTSGVVHNESEKRDFNRLVKEFVDQKGYIKKDSVYRELSTLYLNFREWRNNARNKYPGKIKIDSLQLEFFEGNIKNIIVVGTLLETNKQYIYSNPTPIPFSDILDFKVEHREASSPFNEKYLTAFHGSWWRMDLKDLLVYKPNLNLFTEDYSPMDTVITFRPTEPANIGLTKESTLSLFQGKIFSDFTGLSDDNPNGLIQVEVDRKIIINHQKISSIIPWNYRGKVWFGYLNYLHPTVAIRKIEEDDRYLILDSVNNQMGLVNTLDLVRYSNFSFDLALNLFVWDMRRFKTSFYGDLGSTFYRTPLADSTGLGNLTNVANTWTPYFRLKAEIKPDPRYGLSFTYQLSEVRSVNDGIQVVDDKVDLPRLATRHFDSFEVLFEFRPTGSRTYGNRIFARGRYTKLRGISLDEKFIQLQAGYSFYLFQKSTGK